MSTRLTPNTQPLAVASTEFVGLSKGGDLTHVPGTWCEGTRARIRVIAGPDTAMLPLLRSLLAYPYGCVEQTISQAQALLACRSLLPRFYPDGDAPETADYLATAIDRVLAAQHRDGGFGWWPQDSRSDLLLTSYALEFLVLARAADLQVPEDSLQRAMNRLQRLGEQARSPDLEVFAFTALARAGRPVHHHLERLAAEVDSRHFRLLIGLALSELGMREEALAMLAPVPEGTKSAKPAPWSPFAASSHILDALELRLRLRATPGAVEVATLASRLQRLALLPQALHTQDRNQVLQALAAWRKGQTVPSGAMGAVLVLGDQRFDLDPRKPLELSIRGGEPIEFLADEATLGLLEIKGFRSDLLRSDAGMTLTRTILDPRTGAPPQEIRQGQVYDVVVNAVTTEARDQCLLTETLPGGFEFEPRETWPSPPADDHSPQPTRIEVRDDRLLAFFNVVPATCSLRYRVRAVFQGTFHRMPPHAESLYEPGRHFRGEDAGPVTILGNTRIPK